MMPKMTDFPRKVMFSLSLFVSFLIWKTAGSSSSLVAVAGCDGRSDKKELQESIDWKLILFPLSLFLTPTLQDMTTALLHAHRCMLKDEPVPVPVPLNTIPDMIVPSHIIVPRCSGESTRTEAERQSRNILVTTASTAAFRTWNLFISEQSSNW